MFASIQLEYNYNLNNRWICMAVDHCAKYFFYRYYKIKTIEKMYVALSKMVSERSLLKCDRISKIVLCSKQNEKH